MKMMMKNYLLKIQLLLPTIIFSLLCCSVINAQYNNWKMTFSDEFNAAKNTSFDKNKWTAEIGGKGWGNKELQYYTDSIQNVYHNGDGSLVIKVLESDSKDSKECWYGKCKYTSARLITKNKFDQKFGRFESRIKIPRGQGMWSAFWMLGSNIDKVGWANCGEIDIMENIGREPSIVHGTVHGPGFSGESGITSEYSLLNKAKFADDFHIYAIDWKKNRIEFFVDGKLYHTVTPKNLNENKKWVYNQPFFMILNLAIGGNWGGVPDETTIFPQEMLIDYVRVYKEK